MIDLDALAQLVPPHGEGTVALRTSLFVELLDEVRASRGAPLTPEDKQALDAILDATVVADYDPPAVVRAVRRYYQNKDRADRTRRRLLYFHIGLLCNVLERVLAVTDAGWR